MIRRLLEKWLGHDRLLVAHEVLRAELEEQRRLSQSWQAKYEAKVRSYGRLHAKHVALVEIQQGTSARLVKQRRHINGLAAQHLRALTELQWERFLAEQNEAVSGACDKQIRLMDQKHAWEVADLLAERFGQRMFAHSCPVCPLNPITRDRFWHVTRSYKKRPQVMM